MEKNFQVKTNILEKKPENQRCRQPHKNLSNEQQFKVKEVE